jgi:hypothetical protein
MLKNFQPIILVEEDVVAILKEIVTAIGVEVVEAWREDTTICNTCSIELKGFTNFL